MIVADIWSNRRIPGVSVTPKNSLLPHLLPNWSMSTKPKLIPWRHGALSSIRPQVCFTYSTIDFLKILEPFGSQFGRKVISSASLPVVLTTPAFKGPIDLVLCGFTSISLLNRSSGASIYIYTYLCVYKYKSINIYIYIYVYISDIWLTLSRSSSLSKLWCVLFLLRRVPFEPAIQSEDIQSIPVIPRFVGSWNTAIGMKMDNL